MHSPSAWLMRSVQATRLPLASSRDCWMASRYQLQSHGQDPRRIDDIWQLRYRDGCSRGGPILMSAIAGIDQALWDLKGRLYNLPVYEFLGGAVRDKVQVYSWIGGDRPADVSNAAREKVASGFTAIKMNASEQMHYIDSFGKVTAIVERVAAVREATGNDFGIAVDFHGRIHK